MKDVVHQFTLRMCRPSAYNEQPNNNNNKTMNATARVLYRPSTSPLFIFIACGNVIRYLSLFVVALQGTNMSAHRKVAGAIFMKMCTYAHCTRTHGNAWHSHIWTPTIVKRRGPTVP